LNNKLEPKHPLKSIKGRCSRAHKSPLLQTHWHVIFHAVQVDFLKLVKHFSCMSEH